MQFLVKIKPTNAVEHIIAEFDETKNTLVIKNSFIQKTLEKNGILIPNNQQSQYEGKSVIKPGDKLFNKAFKQIYSTQHMGSDVFKWIQKKSSPIAAG